MAEADDGSHGDDVELGPVDVPEEEPIPDAAGSQGDDEEDDEQASQQPKARTHAVDAGGLPAQALAALIGKYFERVGPIIALIGLGTITSTIGGFFSRGPPGLFVYFLADQHWDEEDSLLRDALVQHDALVLFYICLPVFFVVGVLELCYGLWVSRNQAVRAGKRAKTIVLIFSAILLIVTVCFTGAGVNI